MRDARLICALRAVDLPVEEIRGILQAHDGEFSRTVLAGHRKRLAERSRALSRMAAALEDYIEKGIPMPEFKGCRIVEVNIGAGDLTEAKRFYQDAFGVHIVEDTHGDGYVHLQAVFGTWPSDQFFLLNFYQASEDPGRAGSASFGFLVDDLDAVHKRAVSAGAAEIHPPRDIPGMPRCSTVNDPTGNQINLYQG